MAEHDRQFLGAREEDEHAEDHEAGGDDVLTVDPSLVSPQGGGSGLDADLVDGKHAADIGGVSTVQYSAPEVAKEPQADTWTEVFRFAHDFADYSSLSYTGKIGRDSGGSGTGEMRLYDATNGVSLGSASRTGSPVWKTINATPPSGLAIVVIQVRNTDTSFGCRLDAGFVEVS